MRAKNQQRHMRRIDPKALVEGINWRYATKAFDPSRKIDTETWEVLEHALVSAPSSFGLQPWKFIIVTDQAVKDSLVPLSWGQRQIADASHVVVFAVKHPVTAQDVHRHLERTAEVQGTSIEQLAALEKMIAGFIEKPPYDVDLRSWATRQVYIALGGFMMAAALLGVDTCPMEGIDPAGYDAALGLEGTGYFTAVACPAGYRAESDHTARRAKVRFPREQVIVRVGE